MERVFPEGLKQAVFFDLNGTLYDPERTYLLSLGEALAELTGRWLPADSSAGAVPPGAATPGAHAATRAGAAAGADAAAAAGPHARVLAAYAAARREALREPAARRRSGEALRVACLAAALAGSGLPLAHGREALAALDRRVRERGDARPQAAPGAREALAALAARWRLAVLSNGSRDAAVRRLRQLGLAAAVPEARVFAARRPERRKPQPYLFRQALAACRVTAAQAVMVGDSWAADIVGAARCGIDGVWYRPGRSDAAPHRGSAEGRPVHVITRIDELLRML